MPIQRWMASAQGGTSQRLYPGRATMRSLVRNPTLESRGVADIWGSVLGWLLFATLPRSRLPDNPVDFRSSAQDLQRHPVKVRRVDYGCRTDAGTLRARRITGTRCGSCDMERTTLIAGLCALCALGALSPLRLPAGGLPQPPAPQDTPSEVIVEAPEPKYVAPTLRDRIGRIWAPVLINGKGPYRLVLDTGASHSAIIGRVATSLGIDGAGTSQIMVRGVTGSAIVPAIHVDRMEVGELLINPATLPIVADVFGGADGVLGREGLPDKRILADFRHDQLIIARS